MLNIVQNTFLLKFGDIEATIAFLCIECQFDKIGNFHASEIQQKNKNSGNLVQVKVLRLCFLLPYCSTLSLL